ncbi:hypothetical protein CMV_021451 [Castanea mollissima]|uniref:Uncharacterized protein n=1 Tax=Castanea mollissima TaxID=60419 RepID=A0A8J4VF01_9ROSI|nr:hypothetical protein CMV_021451 [Castanea mollissima]
MRGFKLQPEIVKGWNSYADSLQFFNKHNTSPASIWLDISAYLSSYINHTPKFLICYQVTKKSSYLEDLWLLDSFANIPIGGTCSIIQLLHFVSKLPVVQQESGRLRD